MRTALGLAILCQIIMTITIIWIYNQFDRQYDLHPLHAHIYQDNNIENENPESYCYIRFKQPAIEVKPYHYEHTTRDHSSNLKEKQERTIPMQVEWKEKLRLRINKERPAIYQIFKNEIPEDFDRDLFLPNTELEYFDISVFAYDPDHLNIIIRDPDNIRWEVPYENPYPYVEDTNSFPLEQTNFIFELKENPFSFTISRKSTYEVIFKLLEPFVFTDRFIEFNFNLPTRHLYGFGERLYKFAYSPGTFTEFILDRAGELEIGKPGYNGQGHHPMYIIKERSKKWHVGYIRNINGQEFTLDSNNTIKYRMIGGVIDLNFFLGETPEDAIDKYHRYIGGWTIPPFWAMGMHQSKWLGYENNKEMKEMIQKYNSLSIPLDGAWSDIEYQKEQSINFSFDEDRYPIEDFREIFKRNKKRWVPVINTYVPSDHTGPAWDYPGVDKLLMKSANGSNFVGNLFRDNHIIDFWNPGTPKFWETMLEKLREKMYFEGLWIDANENTVLEEPDTGKYSNLRYWPGEQTWYDIRMPKPDAFYYGGIEEIDARDTHCMLQSMYTFQYLKKTNPLPFVLSRATMVGIGKYAFHFFPDVKSTWQTLEVTVASTFNFNIFGIPFSGADICGMGGGVKTPSLLCARWYQMGIFYPFARNHHLYNVNFLENNHQEPWRYTGEAYETIVSSIKLRYEMLKYYYTQFFIRPGKDLKYGMVFKPLEFVFYDDDTLPSYTSFYNENQFMIGDGMMVAPVLNEEETEKPENRKRWVYFPSERWFDLRNLTEVFPTNNKLKVDAPIPGLAPYYLKGGCIYYKQNVEKVLSTEDLDSKFDMIIGFSEESIGKMTSKGQIMDIQDFHEQSVFNNCVEKDCIMDIEIEFDIHEKTFTFEAIRRQEDVSSKGLFINQFVLLGIDKELGLDKKWKINGDKGFEEADVIIDQEYKNIRIIFKEALGFKDGTVFNFVLE